MDKNGAGVTRDDSVQSQSKPPESPVVQWLLIPFFKMLHNTGMYPANIQTLYEAAGGMEGLRKLAHAWHTRVLADEVVSHAFSHGYHPQHTERLAAYWAEALGGPPTYSKQYGDETSV